MCETRDPGRRKTNGSRTDKHFNVVEILVVEGAWVQKRMCDIGWSDETKCPAWREVRDQMLERLRK